MAQPKIRTRRIQTRVNKYRDTNVTVPKVIAHMQKSGLITDLDASYI